MQLALAAIAGAVYLGMSYLASATEHPPLAAVFMGIVPLGATALISAWYSRLRGLSLSLCATCALTIALNLDNLRDHAAWIFFIQHAGAMTLLGITFGSTLMRNHKDALCSRIASVVLPEQLDAQYFHYTWKVTFVWTIFFAISALISVLLFFAGPIRIWSVFANLLTPILLGAMFIGEYLIRLRVMPDRDHFGIAKTISAYREYSRRPH